MHRLLMLTVAAVPIVLTSIRPPAPALTWWTTTALEKVRPSDNPPSDLHKTVSLAAARNEFEPFQIVLRATSQQIDAVDVEMSDLRGPQNSVIGKQNSTVYFEGFVDLKTPSNIEGRTGEWPDPLIPRVDRYYGEKRNAFPFNLADGRNQPIWIEIYVPPATPAGIYRGNVSISVREKVESTIPVQLEVWNFVIPSTSTLPTSFGFSGLSAARQHFNRYTNDDDLARITYIYQKAALLHRISIHGGMMNPPVFNRNGGKNKIDWKSYDAEVGPFLDGTAIPNNEPLAGAKATTVELRTSGSAETDDLKVQYWREFARHFREKGWFERLFDYVWDEPRKEDYTSVLEKARLVHTADPGIRNMVTAPFNPAWDRAIDIWTPLINCVQVRKGFPPFCDPSVELAGYEPQLKSGRSLWWYQSCASHGCYTIGGAYFSGWPSYMIDISPVANRIMEWMTWKYHIQGELYYSMVDAYNNGNPWDNVNRYAGNGDGTLFYPGRPDRIGGKTHIPIESIRLKLIREGLEDYEYLHMLGSSQIAGDSANQVVRSVYEFDHDPSKLYAARRKMGEELNRRGGNTN
jgi:hypothetical protein